MKDEYKYYLSDDFWTSVEIGRDRHRRINIEEAMGNSYERGNNKPLG